MIVLGYNQLDRAHMLRYDSLNEQTLENMVMDETLKYTLREILGELGFIIQGVEYMLNRGNVSKEDMLYLGYRLGNLASEARIEAGSLED